MTVLCYHAVNPEWTSPLSMHPGRFAEHCAWITRNREVLPLREAIPRMSAAGTLPRGAVALTFDDGFASLYDHAWPVLARHFLPATVFLVAQTLTEAGQEVDWIDTPPPYESETLTVDQVHEMQHDGVTFESHSSQHADLTRLTYAECLADLRDSRELLESVLNRPVRLLAYPRGRHAPHVRAAAAKAGYSHAFALPEGPEEVDAYALPRVGLYRSNGVRAVRIKTAAPYLPIRTGRAFQVVRRAPERRRGSARVTTDRGGPIFVVGSMRSGSTMLRLILDSHPRIAVPPETGFMGAVNATKRIPEWQFGEGWYERLGWTEAELDQRLRRFYDEMFRRYAAEQGKSRWGEKTPFHTSHMEQMGRVFPDAAFVGIVRHPGAVASSLRRRFHYGFAEAVAYWSDTNRDLLRGGIALGDRFALCRYEDLVQDGEPVLRRLLAFLGEPWAVEVTEHHRVQREKGAPRAVEGSTVTSDPVDPSRADAWSATVDVDDRRELRRIGTLAAFLGYDADPNGSRPAPLPWDQAGIATGTDLARRRLDAPELSLDVDRRPHLVGASAEELAARLTRAEAALARVRTRRTVRVVDALRKAQHGRSLADVGAAWRVLREAAFGRGR